MYLIGTDEAGYGPNLGPLVVTGTLWKVDDDSDLYDQLQQVISPKKSKDLIPVCDSKQLYSSSASIAALERSVLSLVGGFTDGIENWLSQLGVQVEQMEPWMDLSFLQFPIANEAEPLRHLRQRFVDECALKNVELLKVKTAAVQPEKFNQLTSACGNKATMLTQTTLDIVKSLIPENDGQDVYIFCDKHGGRSKYTGVLAHCLTSMMPQILEEGLNCSRYSWREMERLIDIRFSAKGESSLAVALASMVSKYVREVYMDAWNRFWQIKIPQIKPTKGYPQDAKRFWAEIEATCLAMSVPRSRVWRER